MGKHSNRNRRRMHQSGLGGGLSVVYRLPKGSRQSVTAAELGPRARDRLRLVTYAHKRGIAAAMEAFQVSRSTVYRWCARYDPADLSMLEDRPRRPKRTRRRQWTAGQEQAVRRLRERFPRYGKSKLHVLLLQQGIRLSVSTIGRILASLRRRRLLIEPVPVRVRHHRTQRPYATRVPKDQRQPTEPGQLIQLDTMHLRPLPGVERRQFTAVDVVTRYAVLGVRSSASAITATAFLEELCARMPFPIQAIQVDGGAEFMAGFETACQAREIALYVLPPRSPKLNGHVERLNGTVRREFWECYGGELQLPALAQALRAWEAAYNTWRPHQALGYRTPHHHLVSLRVSHVSN